MSRSRLGPDGVRLLATQLGNLALIIPKAYLDQSAVQQDVLALVLDRADARELSRMLDLTARTGIAPLEGQS